jgi:hypothetical protein
MAKQIIEEEQIVFAGRLRCDCCFTLIDKSQLVIVRFSDNTTVLAHRICFLKLMVHPEEQDKYKDIDNYPSGPIVLVFGENKLRIYVVDKAN